MAAVFKVYLVNLWTSTWWVGLNKTKSIFSFSSDRTISLGTVLTKVSCMAPSSNPKAPIGSYSASRPSSLEDQTKAWWKVPAKAWRRGAFTHSSRNRCDVIKSGEAVVPDIIVWVNMDRYFMNGLTVKCQYWTCPTLSVLDVEFRYLVEPVFFGPVLMVSKCWRSDETNFSLDIIIIILNHFSTIEK